jgi:hypothetical protein
MEEEAYEVKKKKAELLIITSFITKSLPPHHVIRWGIVFLIHCMK